MRRSVERRDENAAADDVGHDDRGRVERADAAIEMDRVGSGFDSGLSHPLMPTTLQMAGPGHLHLLREITSTGCSRTSGATRWGPHREHAFRRDGLHRSPRRSRSHRGGLGARTERIADLAGIADVRKRALGHAGPSFLIIDRES
jgi:hypothetical protein